MTTPISPDANVRLKTIALAKGAPDTPASAEPDLAQISSTVQALAGGLIARATSGVASVTGSQRAADAQGQEETPKVFNGSQAIAAMVQQMRQEQEAERIAAMVAGGQVRRLQAEFQEQGMDAAHPLADQLQAAQPQALADLLDPSSAHAAARDEEMEVLSTLQKHMDKVPGTFKFDDLDKMSKDESLPADLREAYAKLSENPELLARLDNLNLGGGPVKRRRNRDDEKISHGDLRKAFNDPALVEYNRAKSATYTQNYIPSDAQQGDVVPRAMTASDAARELYLYADSLPDRISQADLQRIVDGQCRGKCPAQLQAAAQYMLDNPDEFAKLAPGGKVSRGALENNALSQMHLREDELSALQTLQDNEAQFMRGGSTITRESLAALAQDESVSAEVREAAVQLATNPLLFGMLDNGTKGHEASRKNKTHDGKINSEDIDVFMKKLDATKLAPVPEAAKLDETRELTAKEAQAVEDMLAGMVDDPEAKASRGGKKAGGIFKRILNVVARVLDVVKIGLDAFASVLPPPFSAIAAGIGAGVATVNNFGVKAGAAMLDGVPPKEAYKQAGINQAWDMASSAVSMVPGGGTAAKAGVQAARVGTTVAVKTAAREGAEVAVKTAVREGVEAGTKAAVREGVETGTKVAVREGAETGARKVTQEAAESGARLSGKQGGKVAGQEAAEEASEQSLKESFKEGAEQAAKDIAEDQIMMAMHNDAARLHQAQSGQAQTDALVAEMVEMYGAMAERSLSEAMSTDSLMFTGAEEKPFGVEDDEEDEEEENKDENFKAPK